jgi:DNA polymerase epsilon subunit 2
MTVATRRRYIVRACKQRGWIVQPAALQNMMEYVHSEEAMEDILDSINDIMGSSKTITAETWEEFVLTEQRRQEALTQKSRSKRNDNTVASNAWTDEVQIINAFDTPKLIYDVTRKQFHVKEIKESLFGSSLDKTNMLAQRYALVHQRLLRNELFRPSQLGHEARTSALQHQLTPIESLLGKNTYSKTFLLLGVLVQIEEGSYYLEDPTGQVPVSFQEATAVDDFFVAEHCILLVEGAFHDGTLYLQRVGHPLLESRDVSLAAMQQQLAHPLFTKRIDRDADESPAFVILSDVHLDQPRVLQQLESLFATYEKCPATSLPMFVLMGNFSAAYRDSPPMDELASVLSAFSNLSKHAHFVIVPGPNDTPQQVLPLPPISARLARVANVHMATNPSRIYYKGRELVLFSYNVLHMLQRKQIMLPRAEEDSNKAGENMDEDCHRKLQHRLIKTLLDQSHLLPLQGVPIFWNYDHALRLYPLPDALILGGDAIKECFHEIYGGCHVIHAGSMGESGSYAVFRLNVSDDDIMDENNTLPARRGDGNVVFAKFGNTII